MERNVRWPEPPTAHAVPIRGTGVQGAGLGGAVAGLVGLPTMYFGWICYAAIMFGGAWAGRYAARHIVTRRPNLVRGATTGAIAGVAATLWGLAAAVAQHGGDNAFGLWGYMVPAAAFAGLLTGLGFTLCMRRRPREAS